MRHAEIGTGHLLLGMLGEGGGVAWQALDALGVKMDDARTRIARQPGATAAYLPPNLPFSPRAGKVMELALREALGLGCNYIGTEHVLLGLVREGQGAGTSVLVALGVSPEDARAKVLDLLHGYSEAERADVAIATASVAYPRPPSLRDVLVALEGISGRLGAIERHLGIGETTDGA